MLDHVTLWVLLGAFAAAIAVTEHRRRVAAAAGGGSWPSTGRPLRPSALALARVDARRLVRHPLLWAGVAVTAGAIAGIVPLWTREAIQLLALNYFPLAGGLFMATHLSIARDRHAGMEELGETLPAGARTRTLGHLLGVAWLAMPAGIAAVAATRWSLGADGTLTGVEILQGTPPGVMMAWTPGPLEYIQPAFVVLIAGALAVAAARWWPHPAAAFLIPLLLFSPVGWNAHGVPLHLAAGPRWTPSAEGGLHVLGHVTTTQLAWHLVFLAGYVTLAVAGALLRFDRRPLAVAVGVIGLAAMIGGFVVKVPSFAWLG